MVDYVKGQTVEFNQPVSLHEGGSTWLRAVRFNSGTKGVVTHVNKNVIKVRINDRTFHAQRSTLVAPNGEVWTPTTQPVKRKIGEKPEGDHLDATDPRIQWIFEDAARVASSSGHCYEYDRMCDRLGVPGRMRNIDVTTTVNGLTISTTVKARSTKDAEKIVKDKITAAKA